MDYKQFLEVAHIVADRARYILNEHRQNKLYEHIYFETKDDDSPVTEIDQYVEREMRSILQKFCPDHNILGEEYGVTQGNSEFTWVLDPIDGTRQFIAGIPIYGTLISLCHHGIPILGIIEHPATQERWVGVKGYPSLLNGKPIKTRNCTSLDVALMSSSNTEPVLSEHRLGYEKIIPKTKWRVYGAACYSYACLATGRIDLSIDSGGMREVDYCALVPVIEGAGGVITDWYGKPLTINSGSTVVAASTAELHKKALDVLHRYL